MLLPCLILITFSGFAQQDNFQELVEAKGDEKINRLEQWCNQGLFFTKPQRKIEMLDSLEHIALREKDEIILAFIIFYRGQHVKAMDAMQHKDGVALMKQAIVMAEKNDQELQVAYFKHSLGYYYFTRQKDPTEALMNMLQAHYIFDRIGYGRAYNAAALLDRLAYVYYHLSNYNESIKYLKRSLQYPMENPRRHISILNTIGQSYRELFETDSAKQYFRLSRQQAILAKDTAWIGITSGNIGGFYLSEKSYDRAKPFIQEFYKCALVSNDDMLVVEALTGLAEIELSSGRVEPAMVKLKRAETMLKHAFQIQNMPEENYARKQYIFSMLARAWESSGNAPRSLGYLKEANKIRDSIERRAKLSKNTSIQQMFEAEQTNNRIQLLKTEKQAAEIKGKLYIFLGLLLAIIIVLLYSRRLRERKIQKQKESLLNLEKEKAEAELQSSKEQLEDYLYSLQQKAELIENIQSEMELIRKQSNTPLDDEETVLHKLSYATILTEDDWTRFRILFEKVHKGFLLKLKTVYPGLTPAEIRLCALIRLGLNSQQMAAMMAISPESIKKNRQRLRKKINISSDQKLENIFLDF